MKKQNQPFNTLASLSPEFNGIDDPIINLSMSESEVGITMLFEWEQPQPGTLKVIV